MISFTKKQRLYLGVKRFNAIFFSILFLIILSPLLLIIFLVNLIDTKGHPIFIQDRYGYHRNVFIILKFRTMREDKSSSVWGRFLRFTSFDELLQLINIIKGDMTLIGPRPLSVKEEDIDELRRSDEYSPYNVKPGLTGYAQINFKSSSSLEEKASYDSYYVKHFSLWLDIKILVITVVKLIPINIHKK